jgi:hypothetical protein
MFGYKLVLKDRFIQSILITTLVFVRVIIGFIVSNNGSILEFHFVYSQPSLDSYQINTRFQICQTSRT